MNKKFLLLSAAFAMVSATAGNAKVGGFYVGASGSGNLAQFKIYDASSHTEGKQNFTTKAGEADETLIIRLPSAGAENGEKISGYYHTGAAVKDASGKITGVGRSIADTATITTRSILAEDENNVAEETIYKVRPAAKIFVGYNYQIGSNFVVGVELSGGMTFGAHKYSGDIKVPDLIHFKTGPNNDACYDRDKYPRSSIKTDIELKTRFDGDLAVRLGYLIPGTDGRLALFLRGGVGLINRELKVQLASIDPYVLAAGASGHADQKVQTQQIHNVAGKGAGSGDFVTVYAENGGAKMHALMNAKVALDLMCGYTGYVKNYGAALIDFTGIGDRTSGNLNIDSQQNKELMYSLLADQFLANARTYDTLYYDNSFNPDSASKSETKFTWHIGADAEYHFASGLFVRASYTFKYAKGFFAGNSIPLKTYSKQKCEELVEKMRTDGLFFGFIADGKYQEGNVSNPLINPVANAATFVPNSNEGIKQAAAKMANAIKGKLEMMPADGVSLGTLNSKLGLGDKSFYHEFSIGFGFKFF